MNIVVINGPNLNLLGKREPEIYGIDSLEDIEKRLKKTVKNSDVKLEFMQSNNEGKIVSMLHDACYEDGADGVILNPGAYAHYSIAIRDAIAALNIPVVEVHMTNTQSREEFRHHSVTAGACVGKIEGFGWVGYLLALLYLTSDGSDE